jgi:hypothetical protein
MSLIWHIVRKDFTRLRVPLLAWTLLQLFASGIPTFVWFSDALRAEQIPFLLTCSAVLTALSLLVAYDFSVRLVQEDSPARADVFWRTRPISGLRLLWAKIAGLTLFSVATFLPVAVLQLFAEGARSDTLVSATCFRFLGQLLVIVLVLPFATLTRSLRQCILATLVTFLAVFAGSFLTLFRYDPVETDLFVPRVTLASGIIICTAISCVIFQFVKLQRWRSLTIAAAGLVVSLLVLALWPWQFPRETQPSFTTPEPVEAGPVSITFDRAKLWDYAEFSKSSRRPNLNLEFIITPPPDGNFLSRAAILHHWEPGLSPSIRRMDGWVTDPDARVLLGQMNPKGAPHRMYTRSIIPHEIASHLRSGASLPSYKIDLLLNLHRNVVTEIPLRVGAISSDSESSVRFLRIDPQRSCIELLEHIPTANLTDLFGEQPQFILYNPKTGTVLRGAQFESSDFAQSLSVRHFKLRFGPFTGPRVIGRAEPFTADFLLDAILVKISFPIIGSLKRTIEIPDFKVTAR